MTLRLGLLSTAKINRAVLGGAAATHAVEITAVASRGRERAEAYAAEHGLARAHASYEALLEDPDVDAVYVSLPNALHVPWSVRALEAGKHVLCEKPLTRRPGEAEAAFAAAERAGRVLAEAFMWRHHPLALRLGELLAEGAVGEPRMVRAAFSFALAREADVRLDASLDGGALMDVGCYCVSALRYVAGEPERVAGRHVVSPGGVDLRFTGTAAFPGGALGSFDCGLDVAPRSELEVAGSDGVLFLADPWKATVPAIEVRRRGETERVEVENPDPYACELEDFAAAVRGDKPPRLGAEDAIAQARVIAALYASAEAGADVAV
jgi:D-xylose 1-dehydrogenase (NADP+, D-xylono-1,5-lactone-forming)